MAFHHLDRPTRSLSTSRCFVLLAARIFLGLHSPNSLLQQRWTCEAFQSLSRWQLTAHRPSIGTQHSSLLSPHVAFNTKLFETSKEDLVDSNEIDHEQLERWRAGDQSGIYDALDELQREITLENAYQKLEFADLQDSLRYMDQRKHLLFPNIIKHLVVPLGYAFLLYKLSSRWAVTTFVRLMDFHFCISVVWAPMLFLLCRRITKPKEPIPDDIKRRKMSEDYLALRAVWPEQPSSNWEDPETSCNDPVLFLLEYWVSAVKAMAVIPLLKLLLLRWTVPLSVVTF